MLFRITCAANVGDALAVLHRDRPAVAIIDVVIAGIGGLSLAKRALDLGIPALLMTGAPLADEQLRTIDCPHILKPFRLWELVGETQRLLGNTKAGRAASSLGADGSSLASKQDRRGYGRIGIRNRGRHRSLVRQRQINHDAAARPIDLNREWCLSKST
jgi:DNA-binding NtrC family response regulator